MINRRRFCRNMVLGGVLASLADFSQASSRVAGQTVDRYGPLKKDPRRILDLPAGFSYQIVSVHGQKMSDGLVVPGWPDGMHVFNAGKDRVTILCNHELDITQQELSAWIGSREASVSEQDMFYDHNHGKPAPGAVRKLVYNLRQQKLEHQHLVLAGTLRNCSGGSTPWDSWISCEESVRRAGQSGLGQDHGYCFEVPASAGGLIKAVPLMAMGRFNHEAAVVDPATGIVYMTEDRSASLFYRFIPNKQGQLSLGGKLQALAIEQSGRSVSTANWQGADFPLQKNIPVYWVDLVDVNSSADNLRYQGASLGAATFARGEGLLLESASGQNDKTTIWVMCTSGGRKRLGQIFHYQPSKYEGGFREKQIPGQLALFSEPNDAKLLQNGDNLTVMPNGDLLICEDHYQTQRLIGLTRQGKYYEFAANPRRASEFTGVGFSPDGSTLFVNLQQQGGTLAITGPWDKVRA